MQRKRQFFHWHFFCFYNQCNCKKIFVVPQFPRHYYTTLQKEQLLKGVVIKNSHENKQLLVKKKKLKTTSAGVHFHYIFRKESISFNENKLQQRFWFFQISVERSCNVSLHTYNFCYNLNYRGIITDYICVSSIYDSLLFSIIFGWYLSIISL